MNIVLNFVPLKTGGGVQVALDFINQIKLHDNAHEWFVVATKDTPIEHAEYIGNVKLIKLIPKNIVSRLWFEYYGCKKLLSQTQADIVYTQFGPQWPGAKVLNIVGCAYSNLLYPEVDFWNKLPPLKKYYKKLVDLARVHRMLSADLIIYETKALAERAKSIYGLEDIKVEYVLPSVSSLVSNAANYDHKELITSYIPKGFRVLLLSTYHPNKNFELLPRIAHSLKNEFGINDVIFVITVASNSDGYANLLKSAKLQNVEKNICNIGPVPHDKCRAIYEECDAVILPARLESFSNSIAEAWEMKKPLIISELDWSVSICGNGAGYYEFDNAYSAAKKIFKIMHDNAYRFQVVQNGTYKLSKLSSPKERFHAYRLIIEGMMLTRY